MTTTVNDLSLPQRELLASWWRVLRGSTAGVHGGELGGRRPTLEVLHRLGLVTPPHRGLGEWCAAVTPAGERLACELAVWEEWNAIAEDEPMPARTIAERLGLELERVAAIVYPVEMFGPVERTLYVELGRGWHGERCAVCGRPIREMAGAWSHGDSTDLLPHRVLPR